MSLFGSLMSGFDDDPFFGGHRSIMRQMDQMMSSIMRDPFENDPFFGRGGGGGGGLQAIAGPQAAGALARRSRTAPNSPTSRALTPFGALGMPSIANMMTSLDQMAQTGNCHMYSSSSVMTMTTGPDGKPQVYQATSSTTGVPGGVKETRRTISDSRTGTRSMAIGHHIGERSHIIERENTRGNVEERQEFINLEEDDAAQFDREFRHRTQHAMGRPGSLEYRRAARHNSPPRSSYNPRVSNLPAITASSSPSSRYRSRSRPLLSITAGTREDRARRRDREERGHRSQRRYQPTM